MFTKGSSLIKVHSVCLREQSDQGSYCLLKEQSDLGSYCLLPRKNKV